MMPPIDAKAIGTVILAALLRWKQSASHIRILWSGWGQNMTTNYYHGGTCECCGEKLLQSSSGRAKRYCDSRCRQKAYRARIKEDELNGFYRVKRNAASQAGTDALRSGEGGN